MRTTEIAQRLAVRALQVATYLFPQGKLDHNEWRVGGINGQSGKSLCVRVSGDKAGSWCDFASPDEYKGDLFGLWKQVHDLDDKEAARECLDWLGVQVQNEPAPVRATPPVRLNTAARSVPTSIPGNPVAFWPYYAREGWLIGYEARYEGPDGKSYRPYTHAEDGWKFAGFAHPLPLYNGQYLNAQPGRQVIVCEGAKAADAAYRLFPHVVTTTWPGGAKNAKYADWERLHGRNVILWPDADEVGVAAMMDVARCLGGTVRIMSTTGLPAAFDAADMTPAIAPDAREWFRARLVTMTMADTGNAVTRPDPAPIVEPVPAQEETEHIYSILTEAYLASQFCDKNPGMRHVAAWGKWMEWDGKRWVIEETRHALDLAKAVCLSAADAAGDLTEKDMKSLESAHLRAAVENMAREDRRMAARTDQWDKDTWSLNTPSGVVDLRSGILRAALMDDYCTKITSVSPAGECPQWMAFLRTVCDFDDDLVAFLQRVVGYSLTGDTREQVLFFFYGTGANGKGTFLNTITSIIGEYAIVAGMDVFTESKHDRHPQELARLRGARLVCAQETEQGRRWAESRIKALTGGDPITAHFMRQDDFTFQPQFKLIIAGNHKPGLRNVDEALRRRLHLIPFTVTIPKEQRDLILGDKLKGEAAGILRWAIDGCVAWQRQGLAPPTVVKQATEEYLNSQDTFLLWMDECTQKSGSESTGPLYKSFKNWTEGRGEHPIGQSRFNEMLEHRNFKIATRTGLKMVAGLSLKVMEHAEF